MHQYHQRSGKDRRINKGIPSFPLRDNQGVIITKDRRENCERRTEENLRLTDIEMSVEEFKVRFKNFQKKDDK